MLKYDMQVVGVSAINKALSSIERRMMMHNRKINRMMGATTTRGGAVGAAASGVRTSTRSAQIAKEKSAEIRAAQAVARKKESLEARLSARRLAKFKRETLQKQRLEEQASRRSLARFKAKTIQENRDAAAAARMSIASSAALRGGMAGGAGRAIGGVASRATGLVSMGGAAVVGTSVAKQLSLERQATMLANKAYGTPGETRSRQQIKRSVMTQAETIGAQTGNREGIIQAIDKFVAISGSLRGGQYNAQFMADISDATGAEMGDVGRTGGQILQNIAATGGLDMSDADDFQTAMKDTQSIMAIMAGHAKVGSIEFADLAQQMGKVMSATSRFDGTAADLANTMGAISQLAIAGGAASPEEAMTSIMRMSDDLVKNSGKFERMRQGLGIEKGFFTDKNKTTLRDPTEIIMDIMKATKGDLTKVKDVFNIRAMKAFEPFQAAFVKAGGVQDPEAGLAAVRKQMGRFKEAGMSRGEVATSAKFTREQTGRRMQILWDDLQAKVGKEFIPVLEDLIPPLAELATLFKQISPYLAAFLKALAKNPLMVGGGLMAGRIGMGMLGGGLGAGGPIVNNYGGTTGGGDGKGGGGKGGPGGVSMTNPRINVMNATLVGAGIGSAIAGAITTWGVTNVESRESKTDRMVGAISGKFGEAEKQRALEQAPEELKKIVAAKDRSAALQDFAGKVGYGVGALASPLAYLTGGEENMATMGRDVFQKAVGGADMMADQRKMDEASIRSAMEQEKQALAARQSAVHLDELTNSIRETKNVFTEFRTVVGAYRPNTGDKPSGVKE